MEAVDFFDPYPQYGRRERESIKKDLTEWTNLASKIKNINKEVKIGIVGKYFNFKSCKDTYISVIESINHAAWTLDYKPNIIWLDSEEYEKNESKLGFSFY